jgi:hypothetical protein
MSTEPDPMTPPEWYRGPMYRPSMSKSKPEKPPTPPEVPYPLSDKAAFEASKEALPWVEDAPAYACKIRSKERAAYMRGYKDCAEVALGLLAPTKVPELLGKIAEYQDEVSRLMDENRRVMSENADHCATIQAYVERYRQQQAKIKERDELIRQLCNSLQYWHVGEWPLDETVLKEKWLIECARQIIGDEKA